MYSDTDSPVTMYLHVCALAERGPIARSFKFQATDIRKNCGRHRTHKFSPGSTVNFIFCLRYSRTNVNLSTNRSFELCKTERLESVIK